MSKNVIIFIQFLYKYVIIRARNFLINYKVQISS